MTNKKNGKNAIQFERLKKQRRSYEIDVLVHEEWLETHPRSNDSKEKVAAAKEKIAALDVVLVTEPPAPELPPHQELVKISGVLQEIDILFAEGFFSDREYAPEEFARKQQSQQWGSVLLAMIGNSAAAAVNSSENIRPGDDYDFIKGKINGIPFYGWVGRSPAKVGDYVEMVGIEKDGHYEVYALAVPALRIMSIIPYCYQGVKSRAKFEAVVCFILPLVLFSALLCYLLFLGDVPLSSMLIVIKVMGGMLGVSIMLMPCMYFHCMKKPRPTILLAQEIFTVYGMDDPTNINLGKFTRKTAKKLKGAESDDRLMPDGNYLVNHYYYY